MKKVFTISLLLLIAMSIEAQSLRDIWINMPDTIVPYLNESKRTQLVDNIETGNRSVIDNLLTDSTEITMISANYLSVSLNSSVVMEIKLLENRDGGMTVCVVTTYKAPSAESTIAFYDMQWQRMPSSLMRPVVAASLMKCADGMSEEEFEEVSLLLDPKLIELHLSESDNTLTIGYSLPVMPEADELRARQILSPQTLRWNGVVFN